MNRDPLVASSALGVTEVLAAVVRKARAGEVSERDRDRMVEHAGLDVFDPTREPLPAP